MQLRSKHPRTERLRTERLRAGRRRAFISMELVMTLPILLTMLLALFQFSLLFYARSIVVEASRAGARAATLAGSDESVVEAEVRRVLFDSLQDHATITSELSDTPGEVVAVGVSVPMTAVTPDLLWMIGISLADQNLYSETRMVRE